jgi:hypothetical protein
MIRIDAVWLAVAPLDMRCGMDSVLARIVAVFSVRRARTRPTCSPTRAPRA